MKTIIFLLALSAATFCGCVSTVSTTQYRLNGTNTGIVYALPKTRLKVSITYTIQKKTIIENGVAKTTTETPIIKKSAVIEPFLIADINNTFVLSGDGLTKDVRLDASFKFQVGTNQLLTGVATDVTDKSPEVFQGLVGSGISIAKMVAAAGEGQPTLVKKLTDRIVAIDEEMIALAAGTDAKKQEKMDALIKEQSTLLGYIAKFKEMNVTKTEERDVVYSTVLDLSDLTWNTNSWETNFAAPGWLLGNFGDSVVPVVTFQVYASTNHYVNAGRQMALDDSGLEGVFYRVPTLLRTKVTTVAEKQPIVLFDDNIPFCQAGPINKVEARYKAFAKRKTTIVFSPVTGSISEYGVDSTSSAEAAAKALDTSLSKVQSAVVDIQKTQAAAEAAKKTPEQIKINELDLQKKLLDAEAALIKSQQELDKLKSGSK